MLLAPRLGGVGGLAAIQCTALKEHVRAAFGGTDQVGTDRRLGDERVFLPRQAGPVLVRHLESLLAPAPRIDGAARAAPSSENGAYAVSQSAAAISLKREALKEAYPCANDQK
jgi:hypothetical protein